MPIASVPNPEPTPYAQPTMGASVFAATLPSLSPQTKYNVIGYQAAFVGGNGLCSSPAGYGGVIGSFTTQ